MKAIVAGVALLGVAVSAEAAPPPASAFGRIPAIVQAAISPDGTQVAILGGAEGQRMVSIATVDQPDLPTYPLGDVEAVDIVWTGSEHLVTRVATWKKMGPRHEYRFERNLSISTKTKSVAWLLSGDENSSWLVEQPVLGVSAGPPPKTFVMGLAVNLGGSAGMDTKIKRKGEKSPFIAALWSVDPQTGRGALVERGDFDTVGWEVDPSGQPRVRLDIDEINHRFSILGRPKGSATGYRSLWSGDFESRRSYYGYSAPDDAIYLALDGRMVRKRLSDGAVEPFGRPPGAYNPVLVMDAIRQQAVAIRVDADRPSYDWLDSEIGAVHGLLSRGFKSQSVELANWSVDRARFVVKVSSPANPPTWYLFDKTRKELSPLGEEYPELKGAALGATRWFTFKARDGLEIPAYLTLPPGAPATGAKAPVIVLPHGGPRARDSFDFDYIVQFLATRGYAVLQPQFRGSWGFGAAFEDAGEGEWAGKMQTDLLDAVAAAAQTGDIDPNRACIAGASFGGYAALAGAAFHPTATAARPLSPECPTWG